MRRPSDGKVPKEVVWIQCAGSRDPELHMPYCSKICCMYSAKQAMLYKHKVHDGQAYVFYIDIRSAGKRYEEFVQRAMEEDRVLFLRGKVSKVFREGDKVMVWGVDTLTGLPVEVAADLVVLSPAMVAREGTRQLAEMLGLRGGRVRLVGPSTRATWRPLETTGRASSWPAPERAEGHPRDGLTGQRGGAARCCRLFARWSGSAGMGNFTRRCRHGKRWTAMKRIGVFVCHCGTNIAGTVDVPRVVEEMRQVPRGRLRRRLQVHVLRPGQQLIREHIARRPAGRRRSWLPAPRPCTRPPSARRPSRPG